MRQRSKSAELSKSFDNKRNPKKMITHDSINKDKRTINNQPYKNKISETLEDKVDFIRKVY
jgi:hypothetical protein